VDNQPTCNHTGANPCQAGPQPLATPRRPRFPRPALAARPGRPAVI